MSAFYGLAVVIFALWLSLYGIATMVQQQAAYMRASRRLATYLWRATLQLVGRLVRFIGRQSWRGLRALWNYQRRRRVATP